MIKTWIAITFLIALPSYADEIQTSTTQEQSSYVQDEFNPYVGLLAGVASTSKDIIDDSSGEFGVEAGYQMRPMSLAVEFSGSEYEEAGDLKDKTNLLLKGQYQLSGENFSQYTFLGLATGVIVRSDNTDFTLGPLAGIDVPISGSKDKEQLSLGAVAKYLFTNSTPTEGVALNGSIKYWF